MATNVIQIVTLIPIPRNIGKQFQHFIGPPFVNWPNATSRKNNGMPQKITEIIYGTINGVFED